LAYASSAAHRAVPREHFGSLDAITKASTEDLEEVNEVGPRIAESIVEFSPTNTTQLVSDLRKAGLTLLAEKEKGTKLAGKTFVLTAPSRDTPATKQRK